MIHGAPQLAALVSLGFVWIIIGLVLLTAATVIEVSLRRVLGIGEWLSLSPAAVLLMFEIFFLLQGSFLNKIRGALIVVMAIVAFFAVRDYLRTNPSSTGTVFHRSFLGGIWRKVMVWGTLFVPLGLHYTWVWNSSVAPLPKLTSYDLSSGDLFSYLVFSEALKDGGWNRPPAILLDYGADQSPLIDLQDRRTVGSAGYIMLAGFAKIMGLSTYQVGMPSIFLVLIAICATFYLVLTLFSRIRLSNRIALALLLGAGPIFWQLFGWYAFNNLVFVWLFLLSACSFQIFLANPRLINPGLPIALLLCSMGVEAYPGMASYTLVPLSLLCLAVAVWISPKGKRLIVGSGLAWLMSTWSLGSGPNLLSMLLEQSGSTFDMGYPFPGVFSLVGIPPTASNGQLGESAMLMWLTDPRSAGILAVIAIGFHARGIVKSLLQRTLRRAVIDSVGLGASIQILFAFIGETSKYSDHKLVLTWLPILGLTLASTIRARINSRTLLAVSIASTSFALANSISSHSQRLESGPHRHSVTEAQIALSDAVREKGVAHLITDFSRGMGWTAYDRTFLPALADSGLHLLEAGGSTSGFADYSGYVVTENEGANSLASFEPDFVCRTVCVDATSGLSAFLMTSAESRPPIESGEAYSRFQASKSQLVIYSPVQQRVKISVLSAMPEGTCKSWHLIGEVGVGKTIFEALQYPAGCEISRILIGVDSGHENGVDK